MNKVDFLSVYPQVYVGNKERAKNKFGGFLSSMYVLTMLVLFIVYIYFYFSGEDFKIQYFRKTLELSSISQFNDLNHKEIEFFVKFESEINDCRVHPFLFKNYYYDDDDYYYDESNIDKCNDNLKIDPNGTYYCFNLSFSGYFFLGISGNCSDENGMPYRTYISIETTSFKIDHKRKYPFQKLERNIDNLVGFPTYLITSKNSFYAYLAQFTAVSYESDKIFRKGKDVFHELYFSDIKTLYYPEIEATDFINNKTINKIYYFELANELNYDFYKREYISLLETLSKIGGFFSPLKLAFSILIQFYSGYEVNYQIVKNLILKKNIYKNHLNNNNNKIKIDKSLELKVEKALNEKKNNINSCLHFFGTIFKCCCQKRKTLRILNKCNEFITEHMSAEHLIFNSILFEKYYEDNPIRNIENIEGLKEIEEELYNYNSDDEEELLSVNELT